jgi:hypothetical protein
MKIPSADIPQADKLSEIVQLVESVARGAETFQDFAVEINKVDRQGRYYRRAAEIIGLIKNFKNRSELTPLGKELIKTPQHQRGTFIQKAVLGATIFQRLIPFLERHPRGVSRTKLRQFITEVANLGGEETARRRMSTIINWLETLNFIRKQPNGDLILESRTFAQAPVVEFSIEEPLVPKANNLKEYETVVARVKNAGEAITLLRDQAKSERANEEHRNLVNLVAARVRRAGAVPKSNQFVDLAAFVDERPFIFEMKSISAENTRPQIRGGISQLYEYRYLQNTSEAILVLVVSKALPKAVAWMLDYIEQDRKIRLLWDGNDQLFGSQETRKELAFLW